MARTLVRIALLLIAYSTYAAASNPVRIQVPFGGRPLSSDPDLARVTFEPASATVSHLSEWSKQVKADFLQDVRDNRLDEWIIVMGNEGGDTDSMVAALAWAYHLTHLDRPKKAVALLQTEEDALDLRPENKLALHAADMSNGHRDLLTVDELPIRPFELAHRLAGISLVDHNVPLIRWSAAKIVSIVDHHDDRGLGPSASPRLIRPSGSCSSLVANLVLDAEERGDHRAGHAPLPQELVGLLVRAIALDTDGLKDKSTFDVDRQAVERLWKRSEWVDGDESMKEVMERLDDEMTKAKKDLGTLSLRDLLRRDWKGDAVNTSSSHYPSLTLGFASVPYSMREQIGVTPEGTAPEWFAVERSYTSEHGADVSVVLNSFKDPNDDKTREIALVVATGWVKRLDVRAADDLFAALVKAVEDSKELDVEPWHRPDGKPLLPRRAVWRQNNKTAGRKVVRPILEKVAQQWAWKP